MPKTPKARLLATGIGGLAVTAAAIGGTGLAASASPAVQAAVPACATSQLRSWVGIPGDSAAGHTAYQLEISNVSGSTCTLYGYPGVSAVSSSGAQLGSAAARESGDPEATVTLAPGATAHAFVELTDTGVLPAATCQPVTASGLRVYPPNTTVSEEVPLSFSACSKAGPVYLQVRTTEPGAGIPGFST